MSLLIYKFYKKEEEKENRKRRERIKRIKRNSKKFIKEIEEQQNIDIEIICLRFFWKLLCLFHKINLEKELWGGLDDEYKQQYLKMNYQKIINLFNETRGLIFYLLFYCVFMYNGNTKLSLIIKKIRMYKKSKLKNGLRIITIPMKSTKTVTVLVMVGTGSKNENEKNRGISHFLEHMFFKGTAKRPTTLDISKELDSVGGLYNAFTGKEHTGFWAKVDSRHCYLALDVISDMLLNSKFDNIEINKEKGTILEELNMYLDNPIMHIPSLFENLLYKNQPLGYDEIGNKKTISAVNRKDFISYYKKHYTEKNIVIVIAGNFDENKIKNKIKKYFKITEKNTIKSKNKTYDKQNKSMTLVDYKKTDQTHLCLGVRGYNASHKDRYVLNILSVILGGNMSSRLFISVREKEGLAYYIHTSIESYSDVGYLATQAGVNNKKSSKAIKIILSEYKKLKKEKVSEEELQKAKDYLKGRMIISLESSDAMASFAANQEISVGKILTLEEKFAKIDTVTSEDIQRVARDIFVDNKLNLAIIGPFKDKRIFEKILKF